MSVCGLRGFDFGENMVSGYCSTQVQAIVGVSTNGMYSSDIGRLVCRTSNLNEYAFVIGATSVRSATGALGGEKIYGYLASVEASPTGIGTTGKKIYINKFSPEKEYEITYSTVYSAVLPATTDIGKLLNLHRTSTDLASISMASLNSTGLSVLSTEVGYTTGNSAFQLTGFDNNRRKVYVRPVLDSGEFAR
jgi:hypothetical protein